MIGFYSCFMCRKIKFGKYELVQYSALDDDDDDDDDDQLKVYEKKICPKCGDDIEEYGHLDDQIPSKSDTEED